jgi:hypothetical protein
LAEASLRPVFCFLFDEELWSVGAEDGGPRGGLFIDRLDSMYD